MMLRLGIDAGSTTVKVVAFNQDNQMVFSKYERHFSNVKATIIAVLKEIKQTFHNQEVSLTMTGSAGMGLADSINAPFVQEVIACTTTVEQLIPETDVVIELGGEDAKITFFEGSLEQRMNGTCAGGTGAFIDQMAALLKTDANGVNELAKNYQTIYPIASRCGVFAKTDIQPLINEGADQADIAASIFQAVVNQTIAGLAAGRKIKGKIAFLGGPLYFMSELRRRFIETLDIKKEDVVFPDNPQLFVAIGAALMCQTQMSEGALTLEEVLARLAEETNIVVEEVEGLPRLFKSTEELKIFRERHALAQAETADLAKYRGPVFLGIDAGSTTTKVVLLDDEGRMLFQHYGNNEGDPLATTMRVIREIYQQLPTQVFIGKAAVTGYGEHLIKHALKIDLGEVETMAHYKAANKFYPGVDFILDIGGQDMKAMKVKEGVLTSIQLNEACSSGCGSFIETFAKSLNYGVEEFAELAVQSRNPVDLGSRCTVFMNSKVKQVQKEGATVGDISAGLSYSVIKNAIYKVIKVRRPEDLGQKIVCQGGTFYNEAVLRAFELTTGQEVVRPSIAGLMGAYGAALIALENYEPNEVSSLISLEEMADFTSENTHTNCGLCENNCMLTVTMFSDGRQFISGNRCERGAKIKVARDDRRENLVDYKYRRLFKYRSLTNKKQTRGVIGIPRILNMYENYPLWHTIFTDLGFRVVLSPRSDKELYELGIETISSDTVCYPAKLVHGLIQALINQDVPLIFYPGVIFEQEEFAGADNHFNCPIVQSYPDVIKNNVDEIREGKVDYRRPFLNLANPKSVIHVLSETFKDLGITKEEMASAVAHGLKEMAQFKADIQQKGEAVIEKLIANNQKGIVLAGRPYHIDPEINHGIANIINQEGFHVLTEDAVSHLENVGDLRVVNQWTYHSRLYAAAKLVAKTPALELVQLNSFGCGIDAVTTDQVEEIMAQYDRIYTVLKIDEGSNLGAIRIRLRSLKASVKERDKRHYVPTKQFETEEKIIFTKEMSKKHTLLLPMLSPIHQKGLVDLALQEAGYYVVCLPSEDRQAVDVGLKYVNNDSCYPAIISIGQLIKALQSGQYDLDNVSVMMTQTGGGCRATNYIPLLRKALKDAGFGQVPVVSISMGNKGVEHQPGFKLTLPILKSLAIAFLYGDLFERVVYRTRPYEVAPGSVDALHQKWLKQIEPSIRSGSYKQFRKNMQAIIEDFDTIPLTNTVKPKVGIVGEILVKYSPVANNDIVRVLENEGAEAVVLDIAGFLLYSLYNNVWRQANIGGSLKSKWIAEFAIKAVEQCQKPMDKALRKSARFTGLTKIEALADAASEILSIGNHTGEGWFLTGEMIELLNKGVHNIVCLQPFGCLPNHVVGKGVIKELRSRYQMANITPVDYDPGASIVNQLNRIKLMMATANKHIEV
ncbi:2-hydroxyacyl-CoA dehydratase [Vagococcus zengguangii]|uniref:2-hydroxyacyl-CoA dehydratase n=1 Tax=Vagococcus zengguangii TaxID=2571750 RepID=UPI0011090274|nr:2-hydroxyacyl-CoA dehydratase [Vagococcus zengguangii]TLG81034.1 2-hydroxyacyl-CoA dehydratase [Vagococcus zengguangii]